MEKVVLKPGKEKFIYLRHFWIFSGAIASFPASFTNGEIYPLYSSKEELLGHAYFNKNNSLCGRVVSFGSQDPYQNIKNNIHAAYLYRQSIYDPQKTTTYRLVHSEGDLLPGLIIDRYGDYLVLQIGTLGMEKLKAFILKELNSIYPWKGIYEKSTAASRTEEKLHVEEKLLSGTLPDLIEVQEEGVKFLVNIREGQKTGLFLDQKQMRQCIGQLSYKKRVLNCFSYTGGFSLFAARGGASQVDSLDISLDALKLAEQNFALNNFSVEQNHFLATDAFLFLREQKTLPYDLVILDPPAFAKKREDSEQAVRGYREINLQAIAKMPENSLLLTCSCSYHVDELLFRKTLFEAAKKARREVQVVSSHLQSLDHPVSLYHREGEYLKGYLLHIGKTWE